MVVERLILVFTTLTLAAALPLSLIAVIGFRGAPFGRMLRVIPVVFLAFIALNVPTMAGIDPGTTYSVVCSSVGVGASLVAAVEALLLLGGYREL